MNDSERRRQILLNETRRLYTSSGYTPAVHPRYRASGSRFTSSEPLESSGTLGIRILICLILFALFAAAEYNGEKIWKYSPQEIISEVQQQPDLPLPLP